MLPFLKTMVNGTLDVPWSIIALLIGLAFLVLGGHWLVHGAVVLARRMGISTLVIGLTIVAFGTSSPELALNVIAAASEETSLAFGNVVGSNIANIGLVIGLSALVAPLTVNSRILRLELPWLAAVTAGFILLAWLPPGINGEPGTGRVDGAILLLGSLVIAVQWYRLGRREAHDSLPVESMKESDGHEEPVNSRLVISWMTLIAGIMLLVAGGKMAEQGAISIARHLGVEEVLIGLTIVAIATTLPEIMTCIIASRRGHADLAIGTVVGSNLFNILLVMGATSLVHPVVVPPDGWFAIVGMAFFTVLLWPLAVSNRSVGRREGLMLLVLYAGVMTWTVLRQLQHAT